MIIDLLIYAFVWNLMIIGILIYAVYDLNTRIMVGCQQLSLRFQHQDYGRMPTVKLSVCTAIIIRSVVRAQKTATITT